MTHELKTWPEYFALVENNTKTFEVRRNDRHFKTGDTLILKEWSVTEGYTGKQIEAVVTYVFRGGNLGGLQPGFVVLSIKRL